MDDEGTSFYVFDQAVEIELPWGAEPDQVEPIVRDLWRHLEVLSRLGFSAIYDTERDTMLNLETDFDVVVQRYRQNLTDEDDDNSDAPVAAERSGQGENPARDVGSQHAPATATRASTEQPFTGNVGASKPWWKVL